MIKLRREQPGSQEHRVAMVKAIGFVAEKVGKEGGRT